MKKVIKLDRERDECIEELAPSAVRKNIDIFPNMQRTVIEDQDIDVEDHSIRPTGIAISKYALFFTLDGPNPLKYT